MSATSAAPSARVRSSPPVDRRAGRALADLNFCLGRAYHACVALTRKVLAETGLDAHIAPGMGHILYALFERDDLVIKEIAERTSLSLSTLTGLLRSMEGAGLVERRRDETDGRAVRVTLTSLGRSLRERCYGLHAKLMGVLEKSLSRAEAGRLRELLGRVLESIEDAGRRG
ncbi:MAG: MarR family winged helix-turn-helix transcriptional regulator [Planctomycetota bacterium]|jgi:DNA-binding MarR family transcriptional regulator